MDRLSDERYFCCGKKPQQKQAVKNWLPDGWMKFNPCLSTHDITFLFWQHFTLNINFNLFENIVFTHVTPVFKKVFERGPVHLLGNDALDCVDERAWVVKKFHKADYERAPLISLIERRFILLEPSRRKDNSASSCAILKSLWWQMGIVLIRTFVFGPRKFYTLKDKPTLTRLILTNVNCPWLEVVDRLTRVILAQN